MSFFLYVKSKLFNSFDLPKGSLTSNFKKLQAGIIYEAIGKSAYTFHAQKRLDENGIPVSIYDDKKYSEDIADILFTDQKKFEYHNFGKKIVESIMPLDTKSGYTTHTDEELDTFIDSYFKDTTDPYNDLLNINFLTGEVSYNNIMFKITPFNNEALEKLKKKIHVSN